MTTLIFVDFSSIVPFFFQLGTPFPLISQRKYNQSESKTTKARKERGNGRKK
jgi:hypothetical protein